MDERQPGRPAHPDQPGQPAQPDQPGRPAHSAPPREISFTRGPLQFRAVDSGPPDGEPVVLLHGFPQRVTSWDVVAPLLHEAGLRTLALDQRGYCATARPRGRRAFRLPELVDDVVALLDHAGPGGAPLAAAHVVGHDWGAGVAWGTAAAHPDRVRSLVAVSVPHPAAFMRAMITSDQLLRSWYMGFFQLPWLPERLLGSGGPFTERALTRMGMTPEMIDRYRREVVADGAIPGGLGWYRALPFGSPRDAVARVSVPTTFVWSDGDPALGRGGAALTGRYVDADYRFVELPGVSHWIPEERPAELAEEIIARVRG